MSKVVGQYRVRVQVSGRYVKITNYDFPQFISEGVKVEKGGGKKEASDKEKLARDARKRAVQKVFRLSLSNEADLSKFVTLTIKNPGITSVREAYPLFSGFIKRLKKNEGLNQHDLRYLGVPELQKRGTVHFHVMVDCRYIPQAVLARNWRQGSVCINSIEDKVHVGRYMAKYMLKKGLSEGMYEKHNKYYVKSLALKDRSSIVRFDLGDGAIPFVDELEDMLTLRGPVQKQTYAGDSEYLGRFISSEYLFAIKDSEFPALCLSEGLRRGYFSGVSRSPFVLSCFSS